MKINGTIIWLLVFIWSIFMGVTAVSYGLGALYPPLNKIAQPFVCPNGQMVFEEAVSNPLPGTVNLRPIIHHKSSPILHH